MIAMTSRLNDLDALVEAHYEPLFRMAVSLSGSVTEASDLTQQAFYVAQTKGHQLQDPGRVRGWLSTTVRRLFFQRMRHERRFPKCSLDLVEHELPHASINTASGPDAELVMQAMGRLSDEYRVPLKLFYLEDRSYKEIAKELGLPIGTVMSRLSRAKAQLREALDGEPLERVMAN
ncbi:MAG TPA: RNA polymerase sigma factor [Roseimicrobium sp.]|nr:RNA polymerase sigma factor [Roseimicrobium sp.]